VHRVDIECFGHELEARGRARATIARRLCTIAGFYRYAEDEGLIAHSPATHVRRPRLDYESHASGLDRNELGALLVAAGLSSARDHALVSLLALNGLRISEALNADIAALGLERGHRTLTVIRKGSKVVTMPLAPRVARALDLAIGERLEGPIFVDGAGERLDRHAAGRIVRRVARQAGITKHVGPHTLRHAFITAALDAGVPLRDVQEAASLIAPGDILRTADRLPVIEDIAPRAVRAAALDLGGAERELDRLAAHLTLHDAGDHRVGDVVDDGLVVLAHFDRVDSPTGDHSSPRLANLLLAARQDLHRRNQQYRVFFIQLADGIGVACQHRLLP
jgi:integrase/recombinase XerD